MSDTLTPTVWPVLSYKDAPAAIAFLQEAFGFEPRAVHTREGDPPVVEHTEMRWPLGGGVMFGSAGKDDSPFGRRTPGNDCVYVVCDDPDALFDRAVAAGAEAVRGLRDEEYAPAASPCATPRATCGASAPTVASDRCGEAIMGRWTIPSPTPSPMSSQHSGTSSARAWPSRTGPSG